MREGTLPGSSPSARHFVAGSVPSASLELGAGLAHPRRRMLESDVACDAADAVVQRHFLKRIAHVGR